MESSLIASLSFAPTGPEAERAEQHAGSVPPAPARSPVGHREHRLPLAERTHARAGVLADTETGETHQKKTLSEQKGTPLFRTSCSDRE